MKNIIYLFIFLINVNGLGQEITKIIPDEIPQGRTFEAVITGTGTDFCFEIDSSSNVIGIYLQGVENHTFSNGYNIEALNDTLISCTFDVPVNSPGAICDLHVITYDGEIIGERIFEVYKERKLADWKWAFKVISNSDNYGASICNNNDFIFSSGFFLGTINIDTFSLVNYGDDYDCYVTKFDTLGKILWAKKIHIVDEGSLYPFGTFVNNSGELYVYGKIAFDGGQSIEPYDQEEMFLVKIDSNGNIIWEKIFYGPGYNNITDLSIDNEENIYITGSIYDSIYINDYKFKSDLSTNNSFVIKLDTAGEFINGVSFGGYPQAIVYSNDNSFYLTGYFGNSISLGGIELIDDSSNYKVPFIAKFDTFLSFDWAKQISVKSEYAMGFSSGLDLSYSDSSIYFLSSIEGTGYFDDLKIITGDGDLVASRLDTAGNFIWAKNFGSTEGIDKGISINSVYNRIYITGMLCGGGICGCSRFGDYLIPVMHNVYFIASFNSGGDLRWIKFFPDNDCLGIGEGVGIVSNSVYFTGQYRGQIKFGEFEFSSEFLQSFVTRITENPAHYFLNNIINSHLDEIISVPFCSNFKLDNYRGLSLEISYDTSKIMFIDSITVNQDIIYNKYVYTEFLKHDSILNISVMVDSLVSQDSAINGTGVIFNINFKPKNVSLGDTIWIIPEVVKEFTQDDTLYSIARKGFILFEKQITELIKIKTENKDISIYPNPVIDKIYVRINKYDQKTNLILDIISLNGTLLYQTVICNKENIISLNKFPSGIYILRICDGNSVTYSKLVKK
jgi:hypothetical protein